MPVADEWKERITRLVQRPPFNTLLVWGVRLMVPRQRVGVALVAFNANEEVFLLRHVFHTVTPWGLPGGWLERDEAPTAGLARELREETGLEVAMGPVIAVSHEKHPPHIVLAYLGWIQPGPVRYSGEVFEGRWFGLEHLPQPMWPFADQAITTALPVFRTLPLPTHKQEAAFA